MDKKKQTEIEMKIALLKERLAKSQNVLETEELLKKLIDLTDAEKASSVKESD